jgi:hypothetical protein
MPSAWNIKNGVVEWWNNGVMEKEIGVVESWNNGVMENGKERT